MRVISLPLIVNEGEVQNGAEPRSEVFLTTYDFNREKIKQFPSFRKHHALGMERLRTAFFEGDGSRKRLFLFDSCYSGDFYGPRYRDEADPIQGYIKHMLESSSTGRVALSSCLPIQKAAEDPALGHGRFTYYLLEALSGRAVEALRRDGWLTVNSLFDYLARQLPNEQRPVLSGVQQDTFELVCYPGKVEPTRRPMMETEDVKHREREARLRALLAHDSSFMRDRLSSFVGRIQELEDIHQRIAQKQQTGGYVTITGQAGQGKSSIIAKLVEEYGPENVAFHFIPFSPGPDHQVGLLRNLMARLILKYDLLDLYVASDSRAALRDYFPKVLGELAAKGGLEVIFIDGLDQLEEDATGVRDLSFLPKNPPQGVAFVLGTRPNDTLRPLELLKPRCEYELLNLSREDFDLILGHRHVQLEKSLADRFYQTMEGNALYLDLVAKELLEANTSSPEVIIQRVADNPENIFSFTIERLMRQSSLWESVMYPALGLLLSALEPLAVRHIGQILGLADYKLREGLVRLGGLIAIDGQQRCFLYHLKLRDYLRQDEKNPGKKYVFARHEEQDWHKKLAQWCQGTDISTIWQSTKYDAIEQRRREYAKQHYLAHLYSAREWQRLFEVLDTVEYGKAKIHDDPSTRAYADNLKLGQQATTWEGWTVEEGIALLPRLWQYTLLRSSLASRADQYPLVAFRLLVLLKREQEALELAELLTAPVNKVRALLQIAEQIREQLNQEREWLALLFRAREIARTIEDSNTRAEALRDLGTALAQAQQWEHAQAVIATIENSYWRAEALMGLAASLAASGEQEQLLGLIQHSWSQVSTREEALSLFPLATELIPRNPELGLALYKAFIWVDTFLKG